MSSEEERRVAIQLVTRDETLKVSDKPIYVPVGLKRYGLSEIVNQLLEREEDDEKPIPFDFLIDGELLRGSLDKYLVDHGLSAENSLTLEYTRSILPPSFLASFPHDDWVSACHVCPHTKHQKTIATGSYDGVVRLWSHAGEVEKSLGGHTGPVKSVKWGDYKTLISASMDRTIHLWNIDSQKNGSLTAILQGHTASVEAIAVKDTKIVSASADTTLRVWSTNYNDLPQVEPMEESKSTSSRKRRKVAASLKQGRTRGCLQILAGHSSPVTGVTFHHSDAQAVYSVSQDHTIRTWDIETGSLVDTKTTNFPLLSVAALSHGLIACGSSARHISLHDPRSKTTTTQSQLIGHTNFVVSLVQSPTNEYMFASGSHDGTVRIWDTRATKAMYTIARESGESPSAVYDADWHSSVGIVSAGQDKKLQINEAKF
ncbi:ribosome biogenesis protein Ytm1p [Trichomonascus vanleenenianus]|uniref:Ytm1p n=1 Tax=Trichomonascus vanleenenianus TaxID=2268995 RepID=UPI003ECAFCD9